MERSWKRIISPANDSDSSWSDENEELFSPGAWRRFVMASKRSRQTNDDGQGTSNSGQNFSSLLSSVNYPNPCDVLKHHDYFGCDINNSLPPQLESSQRDTDVNNRPHSWPYSNELHQIARNRKIRLLSSVGGSSLARYTNDGSISQVNVGLISNINPSSLVRTGEWEAMDTSLDHFPESIDENGAHDTSSHQGIVTTSTFENHHSPESKPNLILPYPITTSTTNNETHIMGNTSSSNIVSSQQPDESISPTSCSIGKIKSTRIDDSLLLSGTGTPNEQNVTIDVKNQSPSPSNSRDEDSVTIPSKPESNDNPAVNTAAINQPSESPEKVDDAHRENDKLPETRPDSLNEVLLGLLECPVCWEVMSPPIHQCRRGHLLCVSCRARLSACPTCRTSFTSARNLAMEKVAEKLKYPCKNSASGCSILVLLCEKREHEANCPHRLYACLSPFCVPRWSSKLSALLRHYELLHPLMMLHGTSHEIEISYDYCRKPSSLDWILVAFDEIFRVNVLLLPTGDLYGCVQYVGPQKISRKYIYELTTEIPHYVFRRIRFERTTHSDQTKIEKYYDNKDSFFISANWTKQFLTENKGTKTVRKFKLSVSVRKA